jgi:Kef-type K+ transport system membrane component KefB
VGHVHPFSLVLLWLAVIVLAATVGRRAASALGQPSAPGELGSGIVIGNAGYGLAIPFFPVSARASG